MNAPLRQVCGGCLRSVELSSGQVAGASDRCPYCGSAIDSHGDEAREFVTKAKWLDAEELFYLGFHFAEKERAEKKFGGEMLRLVVKRSPRSKLAKDAKSKLRGEGLE